MRKIKLLFCIAFSVVFVLYGCQNSDTSKNDKESSSTSSVSSVSIHDIDYECESQVVNDTEKTIVSEKDKNTIVIAFPLTYGLYGVDRTVDILNTKLAADGYPYKVEIQYIDDTGENGYRGYVDNVCDCDADIVHTGLRMTGEAYNPAYTAAKAGKYLKLNDYLEQSLLYDFYPEKVWNSVRINDGVYCIPNLSSPDCGVTLLISKKDFTQEQIDTFDGTFEGLIPLIKANDKKLFFFAGLDCIPAMYESETVKNTFAWLTKGDKGYENILNMDSIKNSLSFLNEMQNDGRILCYEDCRLYSDEWSVALFYMDNSAVYSDEEYWRFDYARNVKEHFGNTLAIRADSHNPKGAFDLLELLITDSEYANLLIYGVDCETLDGMTVNGYGEPKYTYVDRMYWGIEIGIVKSIEDRLTFSSSDECKAYYDKYTRECYDVKLMEYEDLFTEKRTIDSEIENLVGTSGDFSEKYELCRQKMDEITEKINLKEIE